jgi:hypothetical protein
MCSTICDYTLLIKYLCATWCGSVPLDCSYVLPWIDTVVFYFVLIALKIISSLLEIIISQMNDEQRFSRQKMVQNIYSSRLEEWLLYHSVE